MLRWHVLFVTHGSSDCPSPACKMMKPKKTRTLTGFGPDVSCRPQFEGINFPLSPADLLTLLFSHPPLLEKAKRSWPFSPFLQLPNLSKVHFSGHENFLTLAITPHLISAFLFFSLAALFRCVMFPPR